MEIKAAKGAVESLKVNNKAKAPLKELSKSQVMDKIKQYQKKNQLNSLTDRKDAQNMAHPEDDITREKLKKILNQGGFNFSDKERQILTKIL